MEESKVKLIEDWETVFPGVPVPDLSYLNSKATFEEEVEECQQRVADLKFQLRKEEFMLSKLNELKNDSFFISDNVSSTNNVVQASLDLGTITEGNVSDHVVDGTMERSSSINKETEDFLPVCEEKNDNKDTSDLESGNVSSSIEPQKSLNSSLQTSIHEISDVNTNITANISSDKISSLSGMKTHQKSYSMDENTFDFSSARPPIARRLTDPFPTIEEPKAKPRPAPRTLSRGKKKPLPPLPVKPSVKKVDSIEENKSPDLSRPTKLLSSISSVDENVFPEPPCAEPLEEKEKYLNELDEKRTISETSDAFNDEDDEHIYTDINELNIRRERLLTPKVVESNSDPEESEDDEQIYENANMQPRIEPLHDNSSYKNNEEKVNKRKRLGSQDRQAIVLPDDIEVTIGNTDQLTGTDIEAILNGSQESLVDDLDDDFNAPEIIVDNEYDDDDDDEHIYANVDDLNLFSKGSDDDSGSDHDPLSDSISSCGLPSPHYTELTPDQIQSMLQKIQNNSSDQSQDESDSDEAQSQKVKDLRKRITSSSEIVRSTKTKSPELVERTVSTPPLRKPPSVKTKKSPEEVEEKKKHLKASRMRSLLVNNLMDSEKCYMDCLEMLSKVMKPLRFSSESSQPILSSADYKMIFHKAEEMLDVHREFYEQLEPRVEHWNDGQLIGDLFTMIMHSFDIYLAYIGNYKVAMETVLKCRQANQQFSSIMDQDIRIVSLKDPLKLEGLLYKPVDRMTQYSLILNDLLKYTSPDHPDHPLIVEVSGALFDLFEQVNVDNSKKKRRQRQLLKEMQVVEIDDGERRARSLILFNDVIISAKLKPSGDAYVCKWYASLSDINIKPYDNSEGSAVVPVSSKTECDKIRANIANMRQEVRREHMPLQQIVSSDASPPFIKRRNAAGPRSSSRGMEKIKKKIVEQERLLHLISPSIPLNLYHKNGKCYTLLVAVEAERQAWNEALKPRLKRIHARNPPSIQLSSLELQQAFETVLKVQRLGQRFGSQMPSPFLGPTRPISLDFSMFDDRKFSK